MSRKLFTILLGFFLGSVFFFSHDNVYANQIDCLQPQVQSWCGTQPPQGSILGCYDTPDCDGGSCSALCFPGKPRAESLGKTIQKKVDEVIFNLTSGALGWVISKTGYFIGWVLGNVAGLFADLIGWAINPSTWKGYVEAPIVKAGWQATLGLANLGLVLALVIIAIGVILRLETYGSRQLLWRLILVAILVNFSLVIAGVFIDASNLFINYFINQGLPVGKTYGSMLGAGFGISSLSIQNPSGNPVSALQIFGSGILIIVGQVLFLVAATLVMAVVMGALFFMLIVRVLMLWILLILSPLAFVLSIFPGTRTYFKEWWQKFLQWVIFGPVVAFFIWLAFFSIASLATLAQSAPSSVSKITTPAVFLQFVLFTALLIMSMTAAQKLGITGADVGVKLATSAARYPERTISRTGQRALAGEGLVGRAARRVESWTAGRPIIGGVADLIGQARGRVESQIGARAKLLEGRRSEDLAAMYSSRMRDTITGQGILDILDKRGDVGLIGRPALERGLRAARNFGRGSKIENVIPTLAADPAQRTRDIPTGKMENVLAPELLDQRVALALNGAKINRLLLEGTAEQLNNALHTYTHVINTMAGTAQAQIAESLRNTLTNVANQITAMRYDQATGRFT